MNIDEACALLDRGNPYFWVLEALLRDQHERGHLIFERKGGNLVETVQQFSARRFYPIVDKKLKLVFGAKAHEYLRAQLWEYHQRAGKPKAEWLLASTSEAVDRYISEGHGYFISAMQPGAIIVGRRYRPNGQDKDLFFLYRVDFF